MTARIFFVALICLAASGCAIGDGFFGPPINWVEDQATVQPDMRADGYPSSPKEIAEFPGIPM